ncbi:MAG: hypothetical protein NZ898_11550 [Myxococcota bacterium]|nr:hypothetical protein [Myxococcota bacterium]
MKRRPISSPLLSPALPSDPGQLARLYDWSLERLARTLGDRAFAIVTSWQATPPRSDNGVRLWNLCELARDARVGWVQLEGVGRVSGGMEVEIAIALVPNGDPADPRDALRALAVRLARLFEKKLVFVHVVREGRSCASIVDVASAAPVVPPSDDVPAVLRDFFARLHDDGTFDLPWLGVKFADPPVNQMGRWGRVRSGEVGLERTETLGDWLAAARDERGA